MVCTAVHGQPSLQSTVSFLHHQYRPAAVTWPFDDAHIELRCFRGDFPFGDRRFFRLDAQLGKVEELNVLHARNRDGVGVGDLPIVIDDD